MRVSRTADPKAWPSYTNGSRITHTSQKIATEVIESRPMTPQEFVAKWKPVNLAERSAAQQHFLDLCEMLNQPKPASADPDGAWYTFERGVNKVEGGKGWADVWMKD